MDRFFGLDRPVSIDGLEVLTTAHNEIELSILRSILEGEGIPFMTQDRGSGGLVRIITGNSLYGTDIYVLPDDLERATEILEAYRNAEPVEDLPEEEKEEEE